MLLYLSFIEDKSDRDKFIQFYEQYRFTMLHVACSILHDQALAEDAVHEAFMRIAKNIKKIKDNGHQTRAFLVTIVKNISIDMLKEYQKQSSVSFEEIGFSIPDNTDIQHMVIGKSEFDALVKTICDLPIIYSSVFLLKYHHDYAHKDISLLLKIPEATVRKRLQRAKEMLVKLISEKGDEKIVSR